MSTKKTEQDERLPHAFVTYKIRETIRGNIKGETVTLRFIGEAIHKRIQTRRLVTITGVGFFDRNHGQEGVASNGIELHPILDIVFHEHKTKKELKKAVRAKREDEE